MPRSRLILPLLLIAMITLSSGCGVKQADPIQHSAIEVPDGKNSKKIMLKRVVANVNRGAEIGIVGAGLACLKYGSVTWKSGRKSVSDDELSAVFAEELKKFNYRVVGDPSELFEDSRSGAEIAVGGRITSIQYDVCYPMAGWGDWRNGNANASITVEWQIFNTLDKKVVYKKSTSGNGSVKFQGGNDSEALYNSFANAVQGLLADKNFLHVVMEGDPSAPDDMPMGGLSDTGTIPVSAAVSSQDGDYVLQNVKLPGSLDNAKKSVVVLQVPGGHGSGFLLGNTGYILTNQHVVLDRTTVRVIFSDGTKTEGRVLKSDTRRDVALVQIDSPPVAGLPYRLDDAPTGMEVFAIGAPADMNMQGTLTRGIVSGYRKYQGQRWLQSDATINGGNSGGPLLDTHGRVVAVCSRSFVGRGGDAIGLHLFVPITEAFATMGIRTK